MRAEEGQRRRFSELIAQGVADPRMCMLMSMRSDFLGELQKDEPLFRVHRKIDVPPLRGAELREVVSRPAELLAARFETAGLADIITRRTAEDLVKDVGALPLLSYTLDDMWTQMVKRGDGVLRLPAQSFELGGVLVDRADAFLVAHPKSQAELRRIFTLKLATVRRGGADAAASAALRVYRRGMAASHRACRSSQPPSRHGNTRGRGDLRGGGARGNFSAMGQAARLDCCRARVSRLENGAGIGSPRVAGNARKFEERRTAHGARAGTGAKLARHSRAGFAKSRLPVHRAKHQARRLGAEAAGRVAPPNAPDGGPCWRACPWHRRRSRLVQPGLPGGARGGAG